MSAEDFAAPITNRARSLIAEPARAFIAALMVVTGARLVAIAATDLNLGQDEVQYWFWSQTPAFGYFSKPPLIAWAIGASTALFGDTPFAVRFGSPIAHAVTAGALFALGRTVYGEKTGFWAGVAWLLVPGAALSGVIASVDAYLLAFQSLALLAFFTLADPDAAPASPRRRLALAAGLGAAFGAGFLAKYAMLYFLPAAAAAVLFTRARLRAGEIAVAVVVAAAFMAPNIAWNAQNGFHTVAHTAANAAWGGPIGRPGALAGFLAGQLAVFGPGQFALFAGGAARWRTRLAGAGDRRWADAALLFFALTPLAIVSVQAFISRAHANWAAAAYPAATVLIVAWAMRARAAPIFKGGLALHAAAGAAFLVAFSAPSLLDAVGLSRAAEPLRGWDRHGADIVRAYDGHDAIVGDDREVMAAIVYYARQTGAPAATWNSNHRIDHHYEAFHPFTKEKHERVLFVSLYEDAYEAAPIFKNVRYIGPTTAPIGAGKSRTLHLYEMSGYLGWPGYDR